MKNSFKNSYLDVRQQRLGPSLRAERSNPEPWGGPWVASSLRSSQ
jgi:hypothetical protein